MEFGFPTYLRLDDQGGTGRWLTTRRVAARLALDGQCEIEDRVRWISLQSNLNRLLDIGNPSWGLRGFIERNDLGHFLTVRHWLLPHETVDQVIAAVRSRWLVVVREAGPMIVSAADQARAEAWRIASEVDRLTKGRLRSGGRRYTLSTPSRVDPSALGLTRRMLPPREAVETLDRMIEEYAAERELVDLLKKAKDFCTKGPNSEAELVLLRHILQPSTRPIHEAPVTPSQLKQERRDKAEVLLEVVVLDHQGRPLPGIEYTIQTPDGETVSGSLGGGAQTDTVSTKVGTAGIELFLPPKSSGAA